MVDIFSIKKIAESDFEQYKEPLMNFLPPESVTYINKFRKPADFQRSLLGESLVRKCISNRTGIETKSLRIIRSEKGKPLLLNRNDVHFNISHSGDWVVVALSEKEVGIDVEKIREPEYRIAERFFSSFELKQLNALKGDVKKIRFFELWTLKESYLKLLGKGLTQSLGSFSVIKEMDKYKLFFNGQEEPSIHFFQNQPDAEYLLAICSRSGEINPRITLTTLDELLRHQ